MKGMFAKVACGTLALGSLFGAANVNAYDYNTTSVFRAKYWEDEQEKSAYIRPNFKMCVKSDVLTKGYMYIWVGSSQKDSKEWPGIAMNENDGDGVYCYTYPEDVSGEHYDYVIFNDGSGRQTVDLPVIDDSGGLVNSLAYYFDGGDIITGNRYEGRWVVNDTGALAAMVAKAKGLNPADYTVNSYNAALAALGDDVAAEDVTLENQAQYNLKADYISKLNLENDILNKLYIVHDETTGVYSSEYLDAYNVLGAAMNNLVEKKDIVISGNIQNGRVMAAYQSDRDNVIDINAESDAGYEISALTVIKILSYGEDGSPVFGDTEDITVMPGVDDYEYTFAYGDFEGLYINALFSTKTYNMTFVVGENGEIKTIDGDDIGSPVTVHCGDDYSLVIMANEGYEIDKILVNDEEYEMMNGILVIEDIASDTEVKVSFKVKSERDENFEEENGAEGEDEGDNIVVPDTGRGQKMSQTAMGSLIGCVSVGALLGGVLGFINRKRISSYLKK